jgi:hypothetical protein
MCTRLGAAASKSSLAAATRGTALPSWETTWEFVRVLAVDQLGADAQETHREWLARWSAAGGATDPAAAEPVSLAPAGPPSAPETSAAAQETSAALQETPAAPTGEPVGRKPLSRPTRRQAVVACAVAAVVAAVLGSLAVVSPEPESGHPDAAQFDDAIFEGDVTFPDGSVVATGQSFTKVWQLRNSGSMRWEGRYLNRMSSTSCQAPDRVPIPATDPGRSVRIEVPVTAGDSPAGCKIYWKMTDATQRLLLPDKDPIFLDVEVRDRG